MRRYVVTYTLKGERTEDEFEAASDELAREQTRMLKGLARRLSPLLKNVRLKRVRDGKRVPIKI